MKKPSIPLSRPSLGQTEREALLETFDSGWISFGKKVAAFEAAFASLLSARYAVAVSSGTAGLHLAVHALGLGPGDEVITSPFSFVASANCLLYEGATPVFADVDPQSFNLDPAAVEAAITPRTRAILPVHVFGQCCDMTAIMDIADRHGLAVIEDACEAVLASHQGEKCGYFR